MALTLTAFVIFREYMWFSGDGSDILSLCNIREPLPRSCLKDTVHWKYYSIARITLIENVIAQYYFPAVCKMENSEILPEW